MGGGVEARGEGRKARGLFRSGSFLKKEPKNFCHECVKGGSMRMATDKSFCFFFQKEALPYFASVSSPVGGYYSVAP
jgi:hypothetical protein